MSEQEPKIVVDDDWKSQVEKEKQELQERIESGEDVGEQMPEASLLMLVSTLATQAVAALGQFPDPVSGKTEVHKPVARHLIDLLAMLQEKTEGNRTEQESALLENTLHELRMVYVAVADSGGKPTGQSGDEAPAKSSSIELP